MELTILKFEDIDALMELLKAKREFKFVKMSQLQRSVAVVDAADKSLEILRAMLGDQELREIAFNFELGFDMVRGQLDAIFTDACFPYRYRPVEVVIGGERYSDKMSRDVPVNSRMRATFQ